MKVRTSCKDKYLLYQSVKLLRLTALGLWRGSVTVSLRQKKEVLRGAKGCQLVAKVIMVIMVPKAQGLKHALHVSVHTGTWMACFNPFLDWQFLT